VSDRTTYARAAAGYDGGHESALVDAITRAIFEASFCTNANVMRRVFHGTDVEGNA
jgi:hypothetical protein